MTISSVGYFGSVTDVQWSATLSPFLGHVPGVKSQSDWALSLVTGVDRTVRVSAGVGYGYGVTDTNSANVDIVLDTVGSGTRWDAIVARRTWTAGSGGTTTFVKVNGTSVKAVPAGLLTAPGTSADQLLALVQVTAGQQVPTALIDCRFGPDGGMYTRDGADLLVAPMGSTAWANVTLAGGVGASSLLGGVQTPAIRVKNNRVFGRGSFALTNGNGFPAGSTILGTLASTYRPDRTVERSVACEQRSVYNTVRIEVNVAGQVILFVPSAVTDLPHWVSFETDWSPTTTY